MSKIPEKLINFKVYNEGSDLMGIADVSLPDLEYMSETMQGAGIAGEVDSPTIGHLGAMVTTFNFRTVTKQCIAMMAPKAHLLDMRGAIQVYDKVAGKYEAQQLKVTAKVIPKKTGLGKMATGSPMDASGEYETIYLKVDIAKETLIEIDKFNYICLIDGVDYLTEIRDALGM